jgi:hypothetical protein
LVSIYRKIYRIPERGGEGWGRSYQWFWTSFSGHIHFGPQPTFWLDAYWIEKCVRPNEAKENGPVFEPINKQTNPHLLLLPRGTEILWSYWLLPHREVGVATPHQRKVRRGRKTTHNWGRFFNFNFFLKFYFKNNTTGILFADLTRLPAPRDGSKTSEFCNRFILLGHNKINLVLIFYAL